MENEMESTKTISGLRNRLFDTLDAIIKKEISTKEVESVCYVSEQILKSARLELDSFKEFEASEHLKREDARLKAREEKEAIKRLTNVIEASFDELKDEESK